jgi:hypothetical protein
MLEAAVGGAITAVVRRQARAGARRARSHADGAQGTVAWG